MGEQEQVARNLRVSQLRSRIREVVVLLIEQVEPLNVIWQALRSQQLVLDDRVRDLEKYHLSS